VRDADQGRACARPGVDADLVDGHTSLISDVGEESAVVGLAARDEIGEEAGGSVRER